MPPKKGMNANQGGALGRSIIKRRTLDQKGKKNDAGTGFHAADLELSNNPLQSVIDMSSLEDFLSSAVLADRDFAAEKEHVSFVDASAGAAAAAAAAKRAKAGARGTDGGTVRTLRIPRRPRWTGATTADELHRAEKDAFLAWRREVAALELQYGGGVSGGVEEAAVTPFEKNIEVWRQLWRVVERADVLVQIVDARNPLLYRCPDVEAYAGEVNPLKRCLLLVNKADFLTPLQRLAWARCFAAQGTAFVFFSAKREQDRLAALDAMQAAAAAAAVARDAHPLDGIEEEDEEEDEEDDGDGSFVDGSGGEEEEEQEEEEDLLDGSASEAARRGRRAAPAVSRRRRLVPGSVAASSILTARHAMRAAALDSELGAALRKAFILDSDSDDSDEEGGGEAGGDEGAGSVAEAQGSDHQPVAGGADAVAESGQSGGGSSSSSSSSSQAVEAPPLASDARRVEAAAAAATAAGATAAALSSSAKGAEELRGHLPVHSDTLGGAATAQGDRSAAAAAVAGAAPAATTAAAAHSCSSSSSSSSSSSASSGSASGGGGGGGAGGAAAGGGGGGGGGTGGGLTGGIALSDPSEEDMAGIERSDPLYDACRVLNRDELMDLFTSLYGATARPPLGTGDEMARTRRAEAIARSRAAAVEARAAELTRRRDMARRMVEVGLGAALRYGGLADAAGLEEGGGGGGGGGELDAEVAGEELLLAPGDARAPALGEAEHEDRPLMVGFVGYPNVGKSSTINALMGATASNHGAKRVAVSGTPGKTKHFQTLDLNDEITLVDCPGLVFPSFVATREELVVSGVLPIDQMRDYLAPVRLLCQRVPRSTMEAHYGLRLRVDPADPRGAARQPTSHELLDAYSAMRGFMGQTHAGYDHARSARILLKDYCEGRVIYCHPPPGGWSGWLAPDAAWHASDAAARSDGIGGSGSAVEPLDGGDAAAPRPGGGSGGGGGGGNGPALNVLKSASQLRHHAAAAAAAALAPAAGGGQPALTPAAQAALSQLESAHAAQAAHAAAAAAAASTAALAAGGGGGDDSDDDDDEAADSDDLDGLDEATLRQFGRVIIGAAPRAQPAGAAAAAAKPPGRSGEQQGEGEEEEEEEEEPVVTVTTDAHGMTVMRTDAELGLRAKKLKAPKLKGLGRHGSLRKGARPADPYGTEAAADAANRSYYQNEIAASAAGPATTGAADAQFVGAMQATASAAVAARAAAAAAAPFSSGSTARTAGVAASVAGGAGSLRSGASASGAAASAVARGGSVASTGGAAGGGGGPGSVGGGGGSAAPPAAGRKAAPGRGPVAAGGALSKGLVRTVGGEAAYRSAVPSHMRGLVTPAPGAGGGAAARAAAAAAAAVVAPGAAAGPGGAARGRALELKK
jgi:ribosome biogenesis GTPase A